MLKCVYVKITRKHWIEEILSENKHHSNNEKERLDKETNTPFQIANSSDEAEKYETKQKYVRENK